MLRLILLSAVVWVAGCADDRCSVERRMNCQGFDAPQVDARYDACRGCDAEVSPVFREMGDCFDPCVAEKMNYQCSADGQFWDDACALECTGLPSVTEAALRLAEMQVHRASLSSCR